MISQSACTICTMWHSNINDIGFIKSDIELPGYWIQDHYLSVIMTSLGHTGCDVYNNYWMVRSPILIIQDNENQYWTRWNICSIICYLGKVSCCVWAPGASVSHIFCTHHIGLTSGQLTTDQSLLVTVYTMTPKEMQTNIYSFIWPTTSPSCYSLI